MANRPVRSSRAAQPIIVLSDSDSDEAGPPAKRGTKRKIASGRAGRVDEEWAEGGSASDDVSEGPGEDIVSSEEEEKPIVSKRKPSGPARKAAKGASGSASSQRLTDWRRHGERYHDVPAAMLSGGEGQKALLEWFEVERERRGMPWRKRYDPDASIEEKGHRAYEVWVSEVMLQQTQVNTVIPFWKAWLERWPTITSLASATTEEVASAWRGLGYYRRARSLLAGAQRIAADHTRYHGRLPSDPARLEKEIEGVGRYTAGAICSIAYGVTTPIIDGNIHRLLCRLLAMHAPPTSPVLLKKLWAAAEEMVNALDDQSRPGIAGDWNQALMELGSQICKPVAPECKKCPLQHSCKAYAEVSKLKGPPPLPESALSGDTAADGCCRPSARKAISPASPLDRTADARSASSPTAATQCAICVPPLGDEVAPSLHGGIASVTIFPMKKVAKESREELTAVRVLKWTGSAGEEKWLMVKRPEKGLLAGLYEPPSVLLPANHPALDLEAATDICARTILAAGEGDVDMSPPIPHGSFLHVFSHINMTYSAHSSSVSTDDEKPPPIAPEYADCACWLTAEEIKHANIGTGFKKLWAMVYGPDLFGGAAVKRGKPAAKRAAAVPAENGKIVKKLAMPMMPGVKASS